MNFGKDFQDFCEKNFFTKAEAIRILERELEKRGRLKEVKGK